jgi:hypothetical protein
LGENECLWSREDSMRSNRGLIRVLEGDYRKDMMKAIFKEIMVHISKIELKFWTIVYRLTCEGERI